jgi:hypothetical protein
VTPIGWRVDDRSLAEGHGFGCEFSLYDRETRLLENDLDYFAKPGDDEKRDTGEEKEITAQVRPADNRRFESPCFILTQLPAVVEIAATTEQRIMIVRVRMRGSLKVIAPFFPYFL